MPVLVELSHSENVSQDTVPQLPRFQAWADEACLVDDEVVTSMQILDIDEMQNLNREFSGNDKPTNVLSFPMQLPEEVDIKLLGDLAFCAEVINAEAEQQSKSIDAHWAHMVIHGMLHLQGYDHIIKEEAVVMESLEVKILEKLGFEDPYQIISSDPK